MIIFLKIDGFWDTLYFTTNSRSFITFSFWPCRIFLRQKKMKIHAKSRFSLRLLAVKTWFTPKINNHNNNTGAQKRKPIKITVQKERDQKAAERSHFTQNVFKTKEIYIFLDFNNISFFMEISMTGAIFELCSKKKYSSFITAYF